MKSIIIGVNFLAGTHINDAVKEAIELHEKLECHVAFNFNGVDMFIMDSDKEGYVQEYRGQISIVREQYENHNEA